MALNSLQWASLAWSLYRYATRDYPEQESPTYSPDPLRNTRSSSLPVPVVYGKNRIAGNIIYQKTHFEDEQAEEGVEGVDYLIGLCEGPIEDIQNVQVNNVFLHTVEGQTFSVKSRYHYTTKVRFEVTEDDIGGYIYWKALVGDETVYLDLLDEDGETKTRYVEKSESGEYEDSIAITSDEVGTWELVATIRGYFRKGSFMTATLWEPEDIDQSDVRYGYREQEPHNLDEFDQNFPRLANIYVKLKKEHFPLLETPTVTSDVLGKKIKVYDYDTGQWVEKEYSNNPAFCVLDMLINPVYGLGIPESLIDLESFIEAGEYCDEIKEFGGPTKEHAYDEKRFEYDEILDTHEQAKDALKSILSTFRAHLIPRGGKITLKIDKPEEPVQDFVFDPDNPESKDNIVANSFSYSFLSQKQKPNKIIVEFIDPDKGYEKNTVSATHDADIERTGEVRKHELKLYGVKRASQAKREARYYLKQIWFCGTFSSLSAGIDSIHCEVGDVVTVTHPRPGWIGDAAEKLFRVIDMSERQDDERELTLQEYNAAIYEDENVSYDVRRPTVLPDPNEPPPQVEDETLEEDGEIQKDGTYVPIIRVILTLVDYLFYAGFHIYTRFWDENEEVWGSWKYQTFATETEYDIELPPKTGLYEVKTVSENRLGIRADFEDAPVEQIELEGKTEQPLPVTFDTDRIKWGADYIKLPHAMAKDADFDSYEIRKNDDQFGIEDEV